jgi:dTDP-4-dehydrorhamnose reductase
MPSGQASSSGQTAAGKAQVADAAAGAAAARVASKLQLPPVIVATANSTGAVLAKSSRAAAKQVRADAAHCMACLCKRHNLHDVLHAAQV